MSTTSNLYQKAEQQSAAISASNQLLPIGAIQGNLTVASSSLRSLSSGGPFGAQISGTGLANPTLRSEALESDAFKMPVALLVDLWITKYGNDWVDIVDLQDDTFWNIVYVRLKALGEVEVHYLTDRARYVCRKPI